MSNSKYVQVIPSASRVVENMRDIGYSLTQAVADLVDNSIAAKATKIDIEFKFDDRSSSIIFADNGVGMNSDQATEALRFGSEREYASDDLGKYGYGLKTASLSQCSKFTIITREKEGQAVQVREFDLEHVKDTNEWEINVLLGTDFNSQIIETTGTTIIWENLDRLEKNEMQGNLQGQLGEKRFHASADNLEKHLAITFHRFLEGSHDLTRLEIRINNHKIQPINPFCPDEATQQLSKQELELHTDDGDIDIVRFEPYILPREKDFTSIARWKAAKGPKGWNSQQGFYWYRSNRLIKSGGWAGKFATEEHMKLARSSIDFGPKLDSRLGLNISKSAISVPADLWEQLKNPVEELRKSANQHYRRTHGKKRTQSQQSQRKTVPQIQKKPVGFRPNLSDDFSSDNLLPSSGHLGAAIDDAAKSVKQEEALSKIIEFLKNTKPEVARELGW